MAKDQRYDVQVFIGNALVSRKVHGPADFAGWKCCWKVFKTAAISLMIASPGALKAYVGGLKMILLQYPSAWPLLFTADNIMREERWSRLRVQLAGP